MVFTDDLEMTAQREVPELVQLITLSLQSAQQSKEAPLVPSILLPRRTLPLQSEAKPLRRIEEQVLAWFWKNQFEGDRVKKNLHGYPGLFRDLCEPPPWVEDITMSEFYGHLSEERDREIRPLYLHCLEQDESSLLETYEAYFVHGTERIPLLSRLLAETRLDLQGFNERGNLDESERVLLRNLLNASERGLLPIHLKPLDDLKKKIKLARLLGSEAIETLCEAILPAYDEYSVVVGAPDLFLWHPNPAYNLWFFAEVKGRGDHLRESQFGWIRGFWEHVRGHVLMIHVC